MKLYHITPYPIDGIRPGRNMYTWPTREMAEAGAAHCLCSPGHMYEITVDDAAIVQVGLPHMYSSKGDHFWKEAFACEAREAWRYEDFVEVLVSGRDIESIAHIGVAGGPPVWRTEEQSV